MKVNELRELIKESSKTDISNALILAYKGLTKEKKDNLDEEITAALKGKKIEKKKKDNKNSEISFSSFSNAVNEFIDNAENGLYFRPNRIVNKSRRSSWRFEVSGYIKTLLSFKPEDPDYDAAVELLVRLYQTLTRANIVKTFRTEDVFITLQIRQEDLYREVAVRVFAREKTPDNIRQMARVSVEWSVGMTGLPWDQVAVLISLMKTDEEKRILQEQIKNIIAEWEKRIPGLSSMQYEYYYMREGKEQLASGVLYLAAMMGDIKKEIPYYFAHASKIYDVSLYCAFDVLGNEYPQDFIPVYEYGVNQMKIEPREELQEVYENIKAGKYNSCQDS